MREGEPLERLARSLDAYVGYVSANYAGYVSLVRGAASGNEDLQRIYEEARAALTDRIFDDGRRRGRPPTAFTLEDTPAVRLMVRGWSAMAEDVVIAWVRDAARRLPRGPADDARRRAAGRAVRHALTVQPIRPAPRKTR